MEQKILHLGERISPFSTSMGLRSIKVSVQKRVPLYVAQEDA